MITWLLFKFIQKTSNWIVFSSELLDKLRKFSRIAWRIEISILFETLFGQISNSTKERSIDRWILDLRSETRTFLFSFRSREKSKRDDDGNMRRAISVSAIIVRRVSFICHLFGDQFSVYIIIAKKRKTTRVSSNYNDAMIIFSILNRKKNRADSPYNQRCVDILNSSVYRYLNNTIYKHFTLELFSIVSLDKSILSRDNLLINWRQRQIVDFSFDGATFVSKQSFELADIRFVKVHRISPLHFRMFHNVLVYQLGN